MFGNVSFSSATDWGMVFKSNLYPIGLTFKTLTGDKYRVRGGEGERGGGGEVEGVGGKGMEEPELQNP